MPSLLTTPMIGRYSAGSSVDRQLFCSGKDPFGRPIAARDSGVLAAITGSPYFMDAELAQLQRERGSAEALMSGYHLEGRAVLQKIHGSFALAIADCEKDIALLAVDRLGISSLCYAVDGTQLSFGENADSVAQERQAVGNSPSGSGSRINLQGIFDYLYAHVIPAPATIFDGVARLAPGSWLLFEAGRVKVEPYSHVTYWETDERSFEVLQDEFLEIVRGAVRRSAEAAGSGARVGAFLSGGTDSSTIAGMLGEVTGAPANTYSIGFNAAGFDEMEYARIAAAHFKTNHHEYYISPDDLADSIPMVAAAYDQPFGNSSALPAYYCARMARADGIDLMLGGDGGDELFGGNTRYAKQRVFGYYEIFPRWLRSIGQSAVAPGFFGHVPLVSKLRSYIQQASVPMPDRLQTYNLLTRLGYADVLEPGFLARIDTGHPLAELRREYARCDSPSLINRMLALDLKTTLADNDLPKVVRSCALAGVGTAFPFLDDSVLAFAARLKPEYKLKRLQLRWFFKEALRGFLPEAILTKKKHGFGLPFGIWVSQHPRLRELAFGSLEQLSKRGIVRPDFVNKLTREFLSDHATYYGEMIWVLMMLEQWLAAKQPDLTL